MIRNPDFPSPAEMLRELTEATEALPRRLTGPPETQEERVEAYEALRRIAADPSNIRTLCVACHDDTPLLKSAACACGGFVCAACQRIEEDGVCDHTPLVPEALLDHDDGD